MATVASAAAKPAAWAPSVARAVDQVVMACAAGVMGGMVATAVRAAAAQAGMEVAGAPVAVTKEA